MSPCFRVLMICWLLTALTIEPATPSVELKLIDNLYLGTQYDGGLVEHIAYDIKQKMIYAVGKEVFHIIEVSSTGKLKKIKSVNQANVEYTGVAVCDGHVIMILKDMESPGKGRLQVYSTYDESYSEPFPLVTEVEVGHGPDDLAVRQTCDSVVVAVEGEAYEDNFKFKDPEGQIAIVHFPDGMSSTPTKVNSLNFKHFNSRYESELKQTGVRYVYQQNGNKFSNDVEPEFVTIDEVAGKAYVTLQENNAIAEVDLKMETITAIHGLGYKQWGHLDASDEDSGIEISYWPIRAWYQPDALAFYNWNGYRLIFTANEGDDKHYEFANHENFIETTNNLSKRDLGDNIIPFVKDTISDPTTLGRLQFSKYDGIDKYNKYKALYTFGARSFSIWSLTQTGGESTRLSQVYDSGSEFEQNTANYCPHLFNRDGDEVDETSPENGPEPESVALAEINGRLYIFIGNEAPGTIMVYSIGSDPRDARFETIFCDGIPDEAKSMDNLFSRKILYGVDPEDIRYFSADQSPTGRPILMVVGVVTGTVTLLDVVVTGDDGDDDDDGSRSSPTSNKIVPSTSCTTSGTTIAITVIAILCACVLGLIPYYTIYRRMNKSAKSSSTYHEMKESGFPWSVSYSNDV